MPQLEFKQAYSYDSRIEGISVPLVLRSGEETVDLFAYVDTGASHCLFEREYGELLNLDIERGGPKTFSTAAGPVVAFGHTVALEVFDIKFESLVFFFADARISRSLLGRRGWLDRVRLGLIEHDHRIYVGPYDFDSA